MIRRKTRTTVVRWMMNANSAGVPGKVKQSEPPAPVDYTCPDWGYVNCQPPVSEAACIGDYRQWVQQNCDVSFAY
jgi:hypothetical protein